MQIDVIFPNQNRHVRHLLGLYINRKRNELGFSAKEIASQVNLSPHAYRRIEVGKVKINSSLFEKIHSLLFLEIEDLAEIHKIASVKYINDVSKALLENYPA
ncbi:MAG TPA: helix-turn-helix transcriptional regulator [Pseudobdellovibrionaceae bacterium]|jgi:predicted transcriptional regulator